MRDISRRLAEASIPDRAEIACIGRERADLVVAGCAILESIIDLWPAARVGVADRGIRGGILRTLARQGTEIPVNLCESRPLAVATPAAPQGRGGARAGGPTGEEQTLI